MRIGRWAGQQSFHQRHFIFSVAALDYASNGPVAIDNKVILNKVWREFRSGVRQPSRLRGWVGKDFAAYNRYMTAILVWADLRQWTTTEMEATIFYEYSKK